MQQAGKRKNKRVLKRSSIERNHQCQDGEFV